MARRGTEAADPVLAEGYAECERLTRRHGTTYYWGARLLPPGQRVDVYAVYALCRLADDIVDEPETVRVPVPPDPDPGVRLRRFEELVTSALAQGGSSDPVMAARRVSVAASKARSSSLRWLRRCVFKASRAAWSAASSAATFPFSLPASCSARRLS